MLTLVTDKNQPITTERELARAGEATVYTLSGDPSRVAKIYHQPPDAAKVEKLQWMNQHSNRGLLSVTAWPEKLLFDARNRQVRGFLMPKAEGREIHHLYNPVSRIADFPEAGWKFQLHTACNLAAIYDEVHQAGCVIGDVNEKNYFVNTKAMIRLLDCDSFQISAQGRTHFCPVATPQYIPPELMNESFDKLVRTVNHDAFGLAVLIFKLLFVGRHPYQGIDKRRTVDASLDDRIREYRFAHGPRAASWDMQPPAYAPTMNMLPPSVGELFRRAFEAGSQQGIRPLAKEWLSALKQLEGETIVCVKEPSHEHWKGAQCPWCQLIAQNAPEYYLGAGGHIKPFCLDKSRLQHVLRRLAEIEAQLSLKRESFIGGLFPDPRPLPFTFEQLQLSRSSLPAFAEPPPAEPQYHIPPFPEPEPIEPLIADCLPFPQHRPQRPRSLLIEDYVESRPVKPGDPVWIAFPESPPPAPVRRPAKLPRKPRCPEPLDEFDEEAIRLSAPRSIHEMYQKKTWVNSSVIALAVVLILIGLCTTFYLSVLGLVIMPIFIARLIDHLNSDLADVYVERRQKIWEEQWQTYKIEQQQYKQHSHSWVHECQRLSAEARDQYSRESEAYDLALQTWRGREREYRKWQKVYHKNKLELWHANNAQWVRSKAVWDAEQARQWKHHPEFIAWRASEQRWQVEAEAHREAHRVKVERQRAEWIEQTQEWREKAKKHEQAHQERLTHLLRAWERDLAKWETQQEAHSRKVEEHRRIREIVQKETLIRKEVERSACSVFEKAESALLHKLADTRVEFNPEAERILRLVDGCRALVAQYDNAMKQLEQASRNAAERRHLQYHQIDDAEIPGIGEKLKQDLIANGVITAADVDEERIRKIEGFGAVRTQSVNGWRKTILIQFRFNPATSISTGDRQRVLQEFRNKQQTSLAALDQLLVNADGLAKTLIKKHADEETNCKKLAIAWRQTQSDYRAIIPV